ncbi:MAG: hypothetical protein U5L04_08695 [Trueperaceae bacterium]|nr:hypothetical protein [Trueperaceae bacterium]
MAREIAVISYLDASQDLLASGEALLSTLAGNWLSLPRFFCEIAYDFSSGDSSSEQIKVIDTQSVGAGVERKLC